MITVGKTFFDFHTDNEPFARGLYSRWDDFCRTAFEKVADEILSSYDLPDEVITVDRLDIELGTLPEEKFYEQFPEKIAEKLKVAFDSFLQQQAKEALQTARTSLHRIEAVSYYLLHGYRRWDVQEVKEPFPATISHTITCHKEEFRSFLLSQGYKEIIRKRLVWQLPDETLDALVRLTVIREPEFIVNYAHFLIASHPRLHHSNISRKDYRNTVWMVVFAYLWHIEKGHYNRKQLLRQTISDLAAHYGLSLKELLRLLTTGIKQSAPVNQAIPELIVFLLELQASVSGNETISFPEAAEKKKEKYLKDPGSLRKILSRAVSGRKFLQNLQEQEIYEVTRLVFPQESTLLISYAHALDKEKDRGIFEGKAGNEFRLLKWEFLFQVTLNLPAGGLNKAYLVATTLRRLAAHYFLSYSSLLYFFQKEEATLPVWLRQVLTTLYVTGLEEHLPVMLRKNKTSASQLKEQEKLKEIFSHPVSNRKLLSRLKEKEIIRLAEILFPSESSFIISYATELDKGNEKGMLEGKAGNDFRLVKWEFIFLVALSGAFHRKSFVLSVLRQLSAHYGIQTIFLINYFYLQLQHDSYAFPEAIATIISSLWTETEGKKVQADTAVATLSREQAQLATFTLFLRTGCVYPEKTDLQALFTDLTQTIPKSVYQCIRENGTTTVPVLFTKKPQARRFYAALLHWFLLKKRPDEFIGYPAFLSLLEKVETGKIAIEPLRLQKWLMYAVQNQWNRLESSLQETVVENETPIPLLREITDIPFLLHLLAYYKHPSIATFLRKNKKEIGRLLSQPDIQQKLKGRKELIYGIFHRLLTQPDITLYTIWHTATIDQSRLTGLLGEMPESLQWIWIYRMGSFPLRKVTGELLQLEKQLPFRLNIPLLRRWLIRFTTRTYIDYSLPELFLLLYTHLFRTLKTDEQAQLAEIARTYPQVYPGLEKVIKKHPFLFREQKNIRKELSQQKSFIPATPGLLKEASKQPMKQKTIYLMPAEEKGTPIYIGNAGLVLLTPWFPQLFQLQKLTEGKTFVHKEAQIKAIFLLQALLYPAADKEYEEQELLLNKLFTAYPVGEPLPRSLDINKSERNLLDSLLQGVLKNWEATKNTSVESFIHTFLIHEGYLVEEDTRWLLTVPKKGVDILLTKLPWGFSIIKYPWMEKMIAVEWV